MNMEGTAKKPEACCNATPEDNCCGGQCGCTTKPADTADKQCTCNCEPMSMCC